MRKLALATTSLAFISFHAGAQTITPGHGSITDVDGNVWTVSKSGSIREGEIWTPGGGGTAALTIINGVVYGKDDGHGPINPNGWFVLSGNGQYWQASSSPPNQDALAPAAPDNSVYTSPDPIAASRANGSITPISQSAPSSDTTQSGFAASYSCNTTTPNSAASHGGFAAVDGHIYAPDGTPYQPRGINIPSSELGDVLNGKVTSMFPGINFIRLNVRAEDDPASLAQAVSYLTARGIVVELENHPDAGGGQDNWASKPGDVASYGRYADYFKNNPYVWFGTFNEPAADNLSAWERATYDAIRATGNNNPIMLEIEGSPGAWNQSLDPSAYASMINTIWDPHSYGWISRYSTDQATVNQSLASEVQQVQQIKGAGGTMPVIIAEYGDSTNGSNIDQNGTQAVNAVIKSGLGSAAWNWVSAGADALRNSDGSISEYGKAVAAFIKGSGASGCNISPVASLILTDQTITNPAKTKPAGGSPITPVNSLSSIATPGG